jgi:branched-chain amino acid transport system ATP-binding protein
MQAAAPQLQVRDVVVRFGGIVALDGIAFELQRGEILGLIGPNGAGKTTLFNCLSRLYTPASGDIL